MISYYENNFALVNHHNWYLEEIENLMPWERDVYTTLLINYLKEESDRMREQERNNR